MSRSIHIRQEYRHPVSKVWRALTDPQALSEWLMPNDFEPVVGHEFTFETEPAPGFDGIVRCEVLEIEEERKLSYTWRGGPLDTVLTFRLEETAGGTRLLMSQTGFTGLKANLVRLILKSGSRKMYGEFLPAVLDRMDDDGNLRPAPAGAAPAMDCGAGVRRVLLGGALAGLALFVWSAVSWMALPFHADALRPMPHEPAAVEAFLAELPESGIYHYPGIPDSDEAVERMRRGPRLPFLVYRKEGAEPFPPANFAIGLGLNVLAGLLASILLGAAGLGSFRARVLFVTCLGVLPVLMQTLPGAMWWSWPAAHTTAEVLDLVCGWLLAGLVLAALVKPRGVSAG